MDKKRLAPIVSVSLLFIVLVIAAVSLVSGYNQTVSLREDVNGYYAQIVNRIQQRHDKMEQLVSAVEGLQQYATEVYQMITEARAAYASAETMDDYITADSLDAAALSNFLIVVEDNPNITPSDAYMAYIDEVSATENALAVARKDYNDAVRLYNTEARKFPRVLYINLFGFERSLEYWQLPDNAGEIPTVNFGK